MSGKCPCCLTHLPSHSSLDGEVRIPTSGDYTICIECASYLQFDDEMTLVVLDVDDIVEMDNECLSQLSSARNHIKRMQISNS